MENATLARQMAENPERFDFEPAERAEPSASLAAMTGGYTPVRAGFFLRPPRLSALEAYLEMLAQNAALSAEPAANLRAILTNMLEVASHLLYVESGQGLRRARPDEIKEEFDLEEIRALIAENTGLKSSGGTGPKKAPVHPISARSSACLPSGSGGRSNKSPR